MDTIRQKIHILFMLAINPFVMMLSSCSTHRTVEPLVTQVASPAPLQTLDNTKWTLASLNGKDLIAEPTITMKFYPENYSVPSQES